MPFLESEVIPGLEQEAGSSPIIQVPTSGFIYQLPSRGKKEVRGSPSLWIAERGDDM